MTSSESRSRFRVLSGFVLEFALTLVPCASMGVEPSDTLLQWESLPDLPRGPADQFVGVVGETDGGGGPPFVVGGASFPEAPTDRKQSPFHPVDSIALVVYLAALVSMGLYFSRRGKTTEDFFSAALESGRTGRPVDVLPPGN